MSRGSNVRDFRPPKPPSLWAARVYATLVHLFIGFMLVGVGPFKGPNDGDFNLLFLMAIVYWAFVVKSIHTHPRFKQNLILVILLMLLVLFVYQAYAIPLVVLAGLYWLLIIRLRSNSYFLRYHLICALTLGMTLSLIFLLVNSAFLTALHIGLGAGFALALQPVASGFKLLYTVSALILCGGSFLVLVLGTLLGKMPRIPFASSQAQYLA